MTTRDKPAQIRIFLAEGSPSGIRTIDKSNWTGRGVVFPRSAYPEAKKRLEFGRSGVYILFGTSEDSGRERVYVGEGDPVKPRLDDHFSRKEFWTHGCVFTSKDDNLSKAPIQYLESRLIELAKTAKRAELDNINAPAKPSLSEGDVADMEFFLEEMLVCLPVLGLAAFERPTAPKKRVGTLLIRSRGCDATGFESDEGFVVLSGSKSSATEVNSIPAFVKAMRQRLREDGVLVESEDCLRFTQDYIFQSPSTAAAVVLGANANGRTEWKTKNGKTLREVQEGSASLD